MTVVPSQQAVTCTSRLKLFISRVRSANIINLSGMYIGNKKIQAGKRYV